MRTPPIRQTPSGTGGGGCVDFADGFEAECAQVERTSFKTKFLDYLSNQKPILVWGPEYCSAVRVAREFDSAEVCVEPDAAAFLEKILLLKNDPERRPSWFKMPGKCMKPGFIRTRFTRDSSIIR
ncbi:MAG: hypothetical protein WDN00_08515 [Limisphaerales bacterium]